MSQAWSFGWAVVRPFRFVTIYAQRARNDVVLEQLGALTQWMALRVLVPASLAAASFGVAAAHVGHWQDIFFFHVGEAAFVFSFLLTVAIRLPLLRQPERARLTPTIFRSTCWRLGSLSRRFSTSRSRTWSSSQAASVPVPLGTAAAFSLLVFSRQRRSPTARTS
jgi:hypothetical protein